MIYPRRFAPPAVRLLCAELHSHSQHVQLRKGAIMPLCRMVMAGQTRALQTAADRLREARWCHIVS